MTVKITEDNFLVRFSMVLLGVFLISLGVYLFVNSRLGSDPFTVMIEGFANVTGLSIGGINMVMKITILVPLYFLTRDKFGPGTVVNAVFIGLFLEMLYFFLGSINPEFLPLRILMLLGAIISIGSGIAIYVTANLGEGALEFLMMFCKRRSNFSLRIVKVALDVTFGLVGILLGGTIGVGTVIGALSIGPVTQYMFKQVNLVYK